MICLSFKTLNVLFKWIWKNKACYLKMAFQIVEVMRLVIHFLEMMNAGHETGRNTSDLFSYKHASALKVTMMILTHWKICSESPKRRHSCPHEIYWLSLINTSYWYLQNILIHFHCFSNGLSSNNLFCGGSLPNSLLERLIFSAGAVQTQKSFSGHSVFSLHRPAWLCSSPSVNSDVTVHYWSLSGTSGSEVVDSMNILENKQVGHFFLE